MTERELEQVKEAHRLVVEADLLVMRKNDERMSGPDRVERLLDRAALKLLALLGSNEEEER